tara:strand:- start:6342 stop:6533 length:192 start_codon:yes stop_codon:yes gene_type:complete
MSIEKQNPTSCQTAVMRSALSWWNNLTKSQQQTYEMQMFIYGEWWEDNSLCDADILKMYQHYA